MNANTQKLHDLGQRLWLDNITRAMLINGTLAAYITQQKRWAFGSVKRRLSGGWDVSSTSTTPAPSAGTPAPSSTAA